MLILKRASGNRSGANGGVGLAIAGGGPMGGIYELGVIRALDDVLSGLDLNRLGVYVGVSSGSFIAAGLATGLSTETMCRVLIQGERVDGLQAPEVFLQPALADYLKGSTSLPILIAETIGRMLAHPLDPGVAESLSRFGRMLPGGIFDNDLIHGFLERLFNLEGRGNDFRKLRNRLYVVAVDLDTAETVCFGGKGYTAVPISRAVQASSALPGLYPPVKIGDRYYVDGTLRRTMHASVAMDAGAGLVFCINPLVPYDADLAQRNGHPPPGALVNGGLPVILAQTFRTLIYSRVGVTLTRYATDPRYKKTDLIVFEPDRDEAELFFSNVFSYANRHRLCELAYQTTRRDLLARHRQLEPLLRRYGLRLRLEALRDPARTFMTGMTQPFDTPLSQLGTVARQLGRAMDRLNDWIETDGAAQVRRANSKRRRRRPTDGVMHTAP